jgi:hypothetical protein
VRAANDWIAGFYVERLEQGAKSRRILQCDSNIASDETEIELKRETAVDCPRCDITVFALRVMPMLL